MCSALPFEWFSICIFRCSSYCYKNMFFGNFSLVYSFIDNFFKLQKSLFFLSCYSLFCNLRWKKSKSTKNIDRICNFFSSKLLTLWTEKYKWWCCFLWELSECCAMLAKYRLERKKGWKSLRKNFLIKFRSSPKQNSVKTKSSKRKFDPKTNRTCVEL